MDVTKIPRGLNGLTMITRGESERESKEMIENEEGTFFHTSHNCLARYLFSVNEPLA